MQRWVAFQKKENKSWLVNAETADTVKERGQSADLSLSLSLFHSLSLFLSLSLRGKWNGRAWKDDGDGDQLAAASSFRHGRRRPMATDGDRRHRPIAARLFRLSYYFFFHFYYGPSPLFFSLSSHEIFKGNFLSSTESSGRLFRVWVGFSSWFT